MRHWLQCAPNEDSARGLEDTIKALGGRVEDRPDGCLEVVALSDSELEDGLVLGAVQAWRKAGAT